MVVVAVGAEDDAGLGDELDDEGVGSELEVALVGDGTGEGSPVGSRSFEMDTNTTIAITEATRTATLSVRFMTQPYA